MFDANVITLSGRLGKDVEFHNLAGGKRLASFSLAYDHTYKDNFGKPQTETYWVPVVTTSPYLIDKVLQEHGVKGRSLFVQGAIQSNNYNGKYILQIVANGAGGIAPLLDDDLNENTVFLAGRLGADAEIKTLPGKKARKVASMSVAVSRGFKAQDGSWPADWIRVCTSQPTLIDKRLAKVATKGRTVYVTGALRIREYTDKTTGEIREAYEVEVENSDGIKPIVTM